jgi:hypothetical protein
VARVAAIPAFGQLEAGVGEAAEQRPERLGGQHPAGPRPVARGFRVSGGGHRHRADTGSHEDDRGEDEPQRRRSQRTGPVPFGDLAPPAADGRGGHEPAGTDELQRRRRVEAARRATDGDAADRDQWPDDEDDFLHRDVQGVRGGDLRFGNEVAPEDAQARLERGRTGPGDERGDDGQPEGRMRPGEGDEADRRHERGNAHHRRLSPAVGNACQDRRADRQPDRVQADEQAGDADRPGLAGEEQQRHGRRAERDAAQRTGGQQPGDLCGAEDGLDAHPLHTSRAT